MEEQILLLGPRKRCWNLQVKAMCFLKTRGNEDPEHNGAF
jgi:hypothetical protein